MFAKSGLSAADQEGDNMVNEAMRRRRVRCGLGSAAVALLVSVAAAQAGATDPPNTDPPNTGAAEAPGGVDVSTPAGEARPAEPFDEPSSEPPAAYEAEQPSEVGARTSRIHPAHAASEDDEPPKPRGPFDRGSTRVSIVLGGGESFNSSYLILGAGVGYFFFDGLELEADAQAWLFGDPFVATVTPGVRYVFHMVPKVNPYVGTFYRHYFVESLNDFDTYGARAGLLLRVGSNGYLGGGAMYERRFDCDEREFRESCDQWYPEITFSLSF